MSATEAQTFVNELQAQPELQREAEDSGLEAAAARAGFDLTESAIQTVVAEAAADELPDKSASPDGVERRSHTVKGSCFDGSCLSTCYNVGCESVENVHCQ